MSCDFYCAAGFGVSVGAQSAHHVEGGAACPATGASCSNAPTGDTGACTGSGDPEVEQGAGRCSAYADDGDGVVTCQGGGASASALGVVLALVKGGADPCNGASFNALGIQSLAFLHLSMDGHFRDSFTWSPSGGCQKVSPSCSYVQTNSGEGEPGKTRLFCFYETQLYSDR
jgi:hypothetical protein